MVLLTHNSKLKKSAALILQLTSYVEAGPNAAGGLLLFVNIPSIYKESELFAVVGRAVEDVVAIPVITHTET